MSAKSKARFHDAMVDLYHLTKQECDHESPRFRQMLANIGGFETARTLLSSEEIAEGLTFLYEEKRLDLSVEALVLQPEWRPLFTDLELQEAEKRLWTRDYDPYST